MAARFSNEPPTLVPLPAVTFFGRIVGDLLVTWENIVGAEGVGQNQDVLVALVLEIIIDAFLLEQPADKVEIGLPVLDAVLPTPITDPTQGVLEIGETMVTEN